MMFDVESLVRPNIRGLKAYSSARSEYTGDGEIFLDANENAFGSPAGDGYNRYPDPLQSELKEKVAEIKGVSCSRIFVGNGSDEAIDLLYRIFCEPGRDNAVICPPTYGMYAVSAAINDVQIVDVGLLDNFQLDVPSILSRVDRTTKLVFICSPNNPTGNLMRRDSILEIAEKFRGLVIVDEAYIDFADEPSLIAELDRFPNLTVLQTLSKAWGMAGLRLGLAFADPEIIRLMDRVKPPYNVSSISQAAGLAALREKAKVDDWVRMLLEQRVKLTAALQGLTLVEKVYPTDANFLLVKMVSARDIHRRLIEDKIVVRDRSNVELCGNCLRITVGTPDENRRLVDKLQRLNGHFSL